jgi:hypothetical protein
MKPEDIKSTILEIREAVTSQPTLNIHTLRDKYMYFFEEFPKLFGAAADANFPLTFIDPMLKALGDLDSKKLDLDAADKLVYGQLKNKYVDPFFPPEEAEADENANDASTTKKRRLGP